MIKIASILIVFLPLASSIANGLLLKYLTRKTSSLIASAAIIFSAILSGIIFCNIIRYNEITHIILSEWLAIGTLKIYWAIYIDQLTSIMFVVVTFVSAVVHIYSLGYMKDDPALQKFLSYLSLFTFFMLALVSSDNFLQLFFGWEGVGLCSYLLIGFWYKKDSANRAAIKAFIVNRIADFAFIVGIIVIIACFGVADFKAVFQKAEYFSSIKFNLLCCNCSIIDVTCILLFIGCMGKSAQIGLHIWLPDAMEGPTPVSALIHAATMVTAGVFLLARCSYLFEYSPLILQFIAIIGGVTCIFAASIAIFQQDIKKIIAYSTCSQLGYMFLACGFSAYNAAIFHLVTHAFFKALLFLSAGSVIHACHEQDIFKMGGLKDKMPMTYTNFLIGSIALIGIYPLAGFYSKDAILELAYSSGPIGEFGFLLGIIAAVFTAIYSMKIIILVFHGKSRLSLHQLSHVKESPYIMNLPLAILTAGSLCTGMIGYYILALDKPNGYFRDSIFNIHIYQTILNHPPFYIKILPILVGIAGIAIAIHSYRQLKVQSRVGFIENLLKNGYYLDKIYSSLIVKPLTCFSNILNLFDQRIIDRFGPNGFTQISSCLGEAANKTQTGYIFNYSLYIVLFLLSLATFLVVKIITY